jgi:hypothetical protein
LDEHHQLGDICMNYIVDVTLNLSHDQNVIPAIKALRTALDIGLKEAKDLADAARDGAASLRLTAAQFGNIVVAFHAHDCWLSITINKVHTSDPCVGKWDFTQK